MIEGFSQIRILEIKHSQIVLNILGWFEFVDSSHDIYGLFDFALFLEDIGCDDQRF